MRMRFRLRWSASANTITLIVRQGDFRDVISWHRRASVLARWLGSSSSSQRHIFFHESCHGARMEITSSTWRGSWIIVLTIEGWYCQDRRLGNVQGTRNMGTEQKSHKEQTRLIDLDESVGANYCP